MHTQTSIHIRVHLKECMIPFTLKVCFDLKRLEAKVPRPLFDPRAIFVLTDCCYHHCWICHLCLPQLAVRSSCRGPESGRWQLEIRSFFDFLIYYIVIWLVLNFIFVYICGNSYFSISYVMYTCTDLNMRVKR